MDDGHAKRVSQEKLTRSVFERYNIGGETGIMEAFLKIEKEWRMKAAKSRKTKCRRPSCGGPPEDFK
jgi:hypothetical protein